MGAGLSPLLIASASLTYLRFLRLPLVAVSVSGLVVVTVGVRTVAVIRRTKSTGKDELVTAAPIATVPIATAPVAAAAECRSASGRHRHVPMAMAATTTPRTSVYW